MAAQRPCNNYEVAGAEKKVFEEARSKQLSDVLLLSIKTDRRRYTHLIVIFLFNGVLSKLSGCGLSLPKERKYRAKPPNSSHYRETTVRALARMAVTRLYTSLACT